MTCCQEDAPDEAPAAQTHRADREGGRVPELGEREVGARSVDAARVGVLRGDEVSPVREGDGARRSRVGRAAVADDRGGGLLSGSETILELRETLIAHLAVTVEDLRADTEDELRVGVQRVPFAGDAGVGLDDELGRDRKDKSESWEESS